MVKAMTAVENGMSLRRPAEMFGVPKSSLHYRTSGKIQHGARPGPPSYLTLEQEGELVNFLIRCADIGYPHTVAQVIALVQLIVEGYKTLCNSWLVAEISLRTAGNITTYCSTTSNC